MGNEHLDEQGKSWICWNLQIWLTVRKRSKNRTNGDQTHDEIYMGNEHQMFENDKFRKENHEFVETYILIILIMTYSQ